jgi:hypothetical protein
MRVFLKNYIMIIRLKGYGNKIYFKWKEKFAWPNKIVNKNNFHLHLKIFKKFPKILIFSEVSKIS